MLLRALLTTLVAAIYASACIAADENKSSAKADAKEAARDIGHGTKKAAKAVGHGARDATRALGHAFRDGAKEAKNAATGNSGGDNKKKDAPKQN